MQCLVINLCHGKTPRGPTQGLHCARVTHTAPSTNSKENYLKKKIDTEIPRQNIIDLPGKGPKKLSSKF